MALETEYDVTDAIMQLNFHSQIHLAKLIMPHFVAANAGHFVVVSSLAGKMGVPLLSSYSASKFALHGYFDALRAEVSLCAFQTKSLILVQLYVQAGVLHNISVTMVCPGPVESEIESHLHSHTIAHTAPLG